MTAADATAEKSNRRSLWSWRRRLSFWQELPILLVVALLLAVFVQTFAAQAFVIPSGSMESTIMTDDRVLTNKVVYRFREPHRGEVVVFRAGDGWGEIPVKEPANPVARNLQGAAKTIGLAPTATHYIKRVVGLPGDSIAVNEAGRVTINGVALTEAYTQGRNDPAKWRGPVVVPEGHLFVMGDNREHSDDSRVNGLVRIDHVVGRAAFVMWPREHWAGLPVPEDIESFNAK